MSNSIVEFQTQTGALIHMDGKNIQVRSRALVLRFPRSTGGLVWNRPISVSVRATDGHEETLPIHDTTRLIEIAIFGLILFFTLLIGLTWRKVS